MTTKFLDNQICTFKISLSWRFPRKNSVLDDFPLPPSFPLKKRKNIFIVVSPSLIDVSVSSMNLVRNTNYLTAPCSYTLRIAQYLDGGHFLDFLTRKFPEASNLNRAHTKGVMQPHAF